MAHEALVVAQICNEVESVDLDPATPSQDMEPEVAAPSRRVATVARGLRRHARLDPLFHLFACGARLHSCASRSVDVSLCLLGGRMREALRPPMRRPSTRSSSWRIASSNGHEFMETDMYGIGVFWHLSRRLGQRSPCSTLPMRAPPRARPLRALGATTTTTNDGNPPECHIRSNGGTKTKSWCRCCVFVWMVSLHYCAVSCS